MARYDVVVVGGGPGGYVAAVRAAQQGLKTALVEKEDLGGTCLNRGCIPAKALARSAEVLETVRRAGRFGVTLDRESVRGDYAAARKRSRDVSARLQKGVALLLKTNGVDVFAGTGVLTDKKTVRVEPQGGVLEADSVILATGSRPGMIPGVQAGERVMTSRQALELTELPKKTVIIGAGAVGMEFASIWRAFGAEVTIVEMLPRVLPAEDEAVSAEIKKAFHRRGIRIMAGAKPEAVDASGNSVTVTVTGDDGQTAELNCGRVLVSAGIRPNTEGFDRAGIRLNERGYVDVDESMRTNVWGVYAIGDVTGRLALAHVASAQALAAVDAILGRDVKRLIYHNIPRCTFTAPEVASVGLTEAQAKDKGYKVKTGVCPLAANGRAVAYGETAGFVKIVTDETYGEILGVHMVGPHVTETIHAAAACIELEATAEDAARMVYAHPTIAEAMMEAAHAAAGRAIHL